MPEHIRRSPAQSEQQSFNIAEFQRGGLPFAHSASQPHPNVVIPHNEVVFGRATAWLRARLELEPPRSEWGTVQSDLPALDALAALPVDDDDVVRMQQLHVPSDGVRDSLPDTARFVDADTHDCLGNCGLDVRGNC